MPSAAQLRDQIRAHVEAALGPGLPSPFAPRAIRAPATVPTGIAQVDALIGGLPRSSLTEISGPPSSGRTALELALLASLTAKGEVCALVDAEDAFDPASAEAAGVDPGRLLWVRCGGLEQALRSTDLLLQAGGFSAVVVDLAGIPPRSLRRVPLAYWFRFRRAVENTPTVLALVAEEPCARSSASLALRLDAEGACWEAAGETRNSKLETPNSRTELEDSQFQNPDLPPHARLLCGIRWRAEAVRNRNAKPAAPQRRDSQLTPHPALRAILSPRERALNVELTLPRGALNLEHLFPLPRGEGGLAERDRVRGLFRRPAYNAVFRH